MQPDSRTPGEDAPTTPPPPDLTDLLHAWRAGDGSSGDRLFEALYRELRAIAGRQINGERAGATLTATALVNEAYLRLIDQRRTVWADRRHFLAIAATTMRRVLVDRARARTSRRRGGREIRVTLSGLEAPLAGPLAEILDVDRALIRLAHDYPRQAQVVELRFFGGLEEREIGEVLGVAERTVRRDWTFAAAWLARELAGEPAAHPGCAPQGTPG
jgi:RNA polymerase sigma factor (TIGR02999 family)